MRSASDYALVTKDGHWWAHRPEPGHPRDIWGRGDTAEAAMQDCEDTIREVMSPNRGDPVLDWHRANTEPA